MNWTPFLVGAVALNLTVCGDTTRSAPKEPTTPIFIVPPPSSPLRPVACRNGKALRFCSSGLTGAARPAARAFDQAATMYGTASAACNNAASSYMLAAEKYREATITIIAAVASDLFLRGVCGRSVSTQKYRDTLRAQGVNLDGKDIDHIIPRSRGGPDMPWNYNPLDASINRSLQANGMWWKLMNYPLETMNAWAKYASYLLMC